MYANDTDNEGAILARQESEADDCKGCEYRSECANGQRIFCPWQE